MRGKRTFSFVTQNSTIFQKKMKVIELVIPLMIAADANGTDRTVTAGSTHVQLTGTRVCILRTRVRQLHTRAVYYVCMEYLQMRTKDYWTPALGRIAPVTGFWPPAMPRPAEMTA